jgi:hypothetical protein
VARIRELVALQNTVAAEIAEEVRAFAQAEVEARAEQLAAGGVSPEKVESSIVAQLAAALQVSPTRAREQLRMARDLHSGLGEVRRLFADGLLDERRVAAIVRAAAWLSPEERARLDAELAALGITGFGLRRLGDLARSLAARIAPERFAERARAARRERHVSVTPAEDGMAYLRAYLPAEQAIRCIGALQKAVREGYVAEGPVTRTRGQILADTLVERLTGTPAPATDVEVQITVPIETLLDPESALPAEIPGFGPIPRDLLEGEGGRTWRRLLTREGLVVGGNARSRTFRGPLARLLRTRDGGVCSEPYCDAPIRHLDHVRRWKDGGTTDLENGRGLCEFHNLAREIPPPPAARDG